MKKFIACYSSGVQIEQSINEMRTPADDHHAVHVVIPPVVNDHGDFVADKIWTLQDETMAFRTPAKNGVSQVYILRKGRAFFAETQRCDFSTDFVHG